jgi:hypothetical protein
VSFIWPDGISRWIWQRNSFKFCKDLGNVRRRPWKCIDNLSGKKVWPVHWKSKLTETEKARWVKSKVKSMLFHSVWHQSDCSKRFRPGKPKQSIPRATVTFYGDSVKMCSDFAPNFGDKRTGCCITTTRRLTLLFLSEYLTKNNMTAVRTHPTILCFPNEDKIERPSFWHNWGNRGTMSEAQGTVHMHGMWLRGGYWWPLGSKLVFGQMAAPVPEIMDDSLYTLFFYYLWLCPSYSLSVKCFSVLHVLHVPSFISSPFEDHWSSNSSHCPNYNYCKLLINYFSELRSMGSPLLINLSSYIFATRKLFMHVGPQA